MSYEKDHASLVRSFMVYALLHCRGDIPKASRFLDMPEKEFRERMDTYKIEIDSKFQVVLDKIFALSITERLEVFRFIQGRFKV